MSEGRPTADENILFFSKRSIAIKLSIKIEKTGWQNSALMMCMLTNTEQRYMRSVDKSRICEALTMISTQRLRQLLSNVGGLSLSVRDYFSVAEIERP